MGCDIGLLLFCGVSSAPPGAQGLNANIESGRSGPGASRQRARGWKPWRTHRRARGRRPGRRSSRGCCRAEPWPPPALSAATDALLPPLRAALVRGIAPTGGRGVRRDGNGRPDAEILSQPIRQRVLHGRQMGGERGRAQLVAVERDVRGDLLAAKCGADVDGRRTPPSACPRAARIRRRCAAASRPPHGPWAWPARSRSRPRPRAARSCRRSYRAPPLLARRPSRERSPRQTAWLPPSSERGRPAPAARA